MISQSSQECPLPHDFTLGAENEQAEPSPAEKKIELYRIIIENIDGRLAARLNLVRMEKPAGGVGPPRTFTMRGIFRAFCLKHLIEADTNTGLRERLAEAPHYLGLCDLPRVPSYATLSRGFTALASVFGEQALLDEIVAELVNELRLLLLEHGVGEGFAIDSTDIEAYERPKSKWNDDDDDDPDAMKPKWGYRTPKGKRKPSKQSSGKKKRGKGASDKDKKFDEDKEMYFGHQAQAMSDANLGIPVAFTMMSANKNDNPQFIPLIQKAKMMYEWFSPDYVAADKGYDSAANHRFAYKNGIEAVIPLRKTTVTDGMYADVFDESGALTCDDKTLMEYIRTEVVEG